MFFEGKETLDFASDHSKIRVTVTKSLGILRRLEAYGGNGSRLGA